MDVIVACHYCGKHLGGTGPEISPVGSCSDCMAEQRVAWTRERAEMGLRAIDEAIARSMTAPQRAWLAAELDARRRTIGARLAPKTVSFLDHNRRRAT